VAGQKSFWKKYEVVVIIVLTLLFIYSVILFNQKINFFLGNDLIVSLSPNQKSIDTFFGETSNVEFDVSIDNVVTCRAACSYTFHDRSKNQIIDNGDFELGTEDHFKKNYDLKVQRLGSGQDLYSFDVECSSISSFLCFTSSPEKSRSSLVILNYDLTETEKELKQILKQDVTELLELLAAADVSHQQLNQKYFELAHDVNLIDLSKTKVDINDAYDKLRVSIENLRNLWSVEAYIKLNQLFDRSFHENLEKINNSISNLDKEIDNVGDLHNNFLSELKILSNDLNELGYFVDLIQDNETLNNFVNNLNDFNSVASSTINNTFDNYDILDDEIGNIKNQNELLILETKNPAAELFFKTDYNLKFEDNLLCNLRGDCKENISVNDAIKNTGVFIEKYPDSSSLKQNCDLLSELDQKYFMVRNETLKIISDKNINFSGNEFLELANNFKENELRKINNSYFDSFEAIKSDNKTNSDIINIADSVLPKNKTNIIPLNYNSSLNISLYLLSKIDLSDNSLNLINECSKIDKTADIIENFNPISTNITYNIVSKIDTELSDNPPICCIFNECNPCCLDDSCRNDPETFPVVFVHGHSFAKSNSPEYSLDSFNKLQSRLQDDGFLNAGIVSLYSKNEPLQRGVWSLSGRPITVKISYYFDAFRQEDKYIVIPTNSENIDTYAVRLKDLIEIIKDRTNKPKVNIIAYSMGGLVSRRYVQIFGDGDVDKLITIATPNKGISGAVANFCGIIGENRECQDMLEDSLFINKLNDPSKQPSDVELYSIIGQGCTMKSGFGDGIVTAGSAGLENAELFSINGSCSFGETFHTDIIDIDKYPETYELVSEILRE
jgi:hypothetical protein|tara:strand:- start:938 stop:3460 length:2523 start_codon:yes stop_codon:yes gene_type:complete